MNLTKSTLKNTEEPSPPTRTQKFFAKLFGIEIKSMYYFEIEIETEGDLQIFDEVLAANGLRMIVIKKNSNTFTLKTKELLPAPPFIGVDIIVIGREFDKGRTIIPFPTKNPNYDGKKTNKFVHDEIAHWNPRSEPLTMKDAYAPVISPESSHRLIEEARKNIDRIIKEERKPIHPQPWFMTPESTKDKYFWAPYQADREFPRYDPTKTDQEMPTPWDYWKLLNENPESIHGWKWSDVKLTFPCDLTHNPKYCNQCPEKKTLNLHNHGPSSHCGRGYWSEELKK